MLGKIFICLCSVNCFQNRGKQFRSRYTDILSTLIWVQTIIKDKQQTTLVGKDLCRGSYPHIYEIAYQRMEGSFGLAFKSNSISDGKPEKSSTMGALTSAHCTDVRLIHIRNKDRYQNNECPRALARLNSPQYSHLNYIINTILLFKKSKALSLHHLLQTHFFHFTFYMQFLR